MKLTVNVVAGSATFSQEYGLYETRAPRSYDYHGVIQVEESGETRIVAIPEADAPMQTARYQSGMYGVRAFDGERYDAAQEYVVDTIVARLLTSK